MSSSGGCQSPLIVCEDPIWLVKPPPPPPPHPPNPCDRFPQVIRGPHTACHLKTHRNYPPPREPSAPPPPFSSSPLSNQLTVHIKFHLSISSSTYHPFQPPSSSQLLQQPCKKWHHLGTIVSRQWDNLCQGCTSAQSRRSVLGISSPFKLSHDHSLSPLLYKITPQLLKHLIPRGRTIKTSYRRFTFACPVSLERVLVDSREASEVRFNVDLWGTNSCKVETLFFVELYHQKQTMTISGRNILAQ